MSDAPAASLGVRVDGAVPERVDARVRTVVQGLAAAEGLAATDGGRVDEEACRRLGFSGALGETAVVSSEGRLEVLVGLGPEARLGREALRQAGAATVRLLESCATVAVQLDRRLAAVVGATAAARSLAEGALLAGHRFTRYRTGLGEGGRARNPSPVLAELVIVAAPEDRDEAERGSERGAAVAEAVCLSRDLVDTPAGDLPPSAFAERAAAVAEAEGLELLVYDEEAARREGLGGLLGVAAGSAQPPRLVRLGYRPAGEAAGARPLRVALVGKGITFDSGGLSLKPPASMVSMKTDMSGAAAVLATLGACRRLGIEVEVVGFMPLAENMPGGRATKPGDVLRIRNGKTIEVLNTDAEGRLVLADALSLATEEHPDAVVDLATLTGACVVALGRSVAGLLGNDQRLVEAVRAAGLQAGEPAWPLPLPRSYRRLVDSEVADMQNQGVPGQAGAIAAGLILQEFVGDVPWAHLDIAGPARSEEDSGYLHKGATGFGVRTLLELLEHYRPLGGVAAPDPLGAVQLP